MISTKKVIEDIMDSLINSTRKFLKDKVEITSIKEQEVPKILKERLKDFNAILEVKGQGLYEVLIAVDCKLGYKLTDEFVLCDLSLEEIEEYTPDTIVETLNTIIGNSTQELTEKNIPISFTPPALICNKDREFKVKQNNVVLYNIKTEEGELNLILKEK